jgi:formiminoglutamase
VSLPTDPLWPRAGGWPAVSELDPGERIDLAIIGIPAWRTSISPTGAHRTPAAIREALPRYSPSLMHDRSARHSTPDDRLDLRTPRVADAGDVEEPDGPAGEARTIAQVADIADRAGLTVALGGDNSLTFTTALGVWGDDLDKAGLITLDAHYDLRDGESNGSPVRRLIEAGLDGTRVVQIGIQDFANSREYAQRAADYGITVVHRDELARRPMTDVIDEALHIAGSAGGPVHVDFDVDVCDRSVVPACPASVPGGISAWELRQAVRAACRDERVRSIDFAEIDATADAADGRTVRLAALCVLEALAGVALRD